MKVLHIITGLNTGGAEMMLYKLLNGMDQTRFSPVVITLMDGGTLRQRFVDMDIEVHSLGMKRSIPSISAMVKLWKYVKIIKPDVIQGWMYHGNMVASLARVMGRNKSQCLWNIRQSIYDLKKEKRLTSCLIRLGAYLSFSPNRILYNSRLSARQHEKLGYDNKKTLVIPNGFSVDVFKPDSLAKQRVRQTLGMADDVFLVGIIGRFHPMKDHHNFLSAAAMILDKHPNVRFLMAGRDINKANIALLQWMDKLNLNEQICLLGERADISSLNAALDVAVLSSAWGDAFPNVVGEAMACGVPCVVTDVGDAAYIVGKTGLVVSVSNSEALANAMMTMIEMSDLKRSKIGEMARERVVALFSMESVVKQYEKLYRGVR